MSQPALALFCLFQITAGIQADGDTAPDVMNVAREAQQAGDYRRAKELLTQGLSKAGVFPPNDSRRTAAELQLAESLLELGEYFRCEELCTQSIEAVEKQFGEEHLQIAEAERILADLYLRLEMAVLADQHCKRGLNICESIHGRQHPDVFAFWVMMRQIWNLRSGSGNSNDAAAALKFLQNSFGESSPLLIAPLEALAGDCYDRWTPADAARAASIAEKNYGECHPVYGRCLSTYATALRHTRDFDEAELKSKLAIELLVTAIGPNCPQLSAAYRNLASVERHRGHPERADSLFRDSIRLRFSTLSDNELCHFFEQLHDSDQLQSYDDHLFDAYLTEMTRRKGEVIEQFLIKKIDDLREKYELATKELKGDEPDEDKALDKVFDVMRRMERYSKNLEFVTSLCRIQNNADPFQIVVEGSHDLTCEFPEQPVLNVMIRNVDPEKRNIGFQESGDYRSGRQARWRIEVRDAAGRIRPFKELHGIVMGGGLFNWTTLEPGQGWETTLKMSSFVETLEPGEYQIRVLYHSELTIVDWEFVAGLVTCRSEPIKLKVARRSIQISDQQQQAVAKLLKEFDNKQPCKVVDGKYGEWAHNFIIPDTDYGRLLTLDWVAVPALIDDLEQSDSPERRAHMLALLFSITGENDPNSGNPLGLPRRSALGPCSVLKSGWRVWSKGRGDDGGGSGGFGFSSGPRAYESKLDPQAQDAFVKKWLGIKSRYEVTSSN